MSCQFLVGSTITLSTRALDDDGVPIPQALYSLYIRQGTTAQLPTINGVSFTYNATTQRYEYYYTPTLSGPLRYRFDVPINTYNAGKEATITVQPTVFTL